MTTYFYQRWESFLQNHRCELRKVKKTENPCNELKVQLISFLYYLKEDLHSIDHIIVPINANNKHWILCVRKEKVICHCNDKCIFYFKVIDFITQNITCYDSMVESHLYSCQAISSDMQ